MTKRQHPLVARQTWRAGLLAYLTLIILGTGATMAAALWSQQATVTTHVTTGAWTTNTPGWAWSPTVSAQGTPRGTNLDVAFTWTPAPKPGTVAYQAGLVAVSPGARVITNLTAAGTSAAFRIAPPNQGAYTYRLTLVASVNGVSSAAVVRTLTVNADGSLQLT